MTENGNPPEKSTVVLTLDHRTMQLNIEGKAISADVALSMLAQAEREMKFQWNLERTMRVQMEMQRQAHVQEILRKH